MAYRKLTTAQVEALKAAAYKVEPGIVIIHPTTNEILGVVDGLGNLTELGGGGPGGAVAFTDLTDAPSSITGSAILSGNNAGTALEFSPYISGMRAGVHWVDESDNAFSSGSIDLARAPYNLGTPTVGEHILVSGLNSVDNADCGIWVLTAIVADVGSVERRGDTPVGSRIYTGETVTTLDGVINVWQMFTVNGAPPAAAFVTISTDNNDGYPFWRKIYPEV